MECPWYGLGTLCGLFGYSRQSYYKWDSREFAENAVEPLIVEKVSEYRKNNPGLGCAKLYLIVRQLFENTGSMPGRDAFIEQLRKNGLMVRLKRRRHYRTTDSRHHYRKYPNLIADIVPSRPNEIWVSDITYVETDEGGMLSVAYNGCLFAQDSRLVCRSHTGDRLSVGCTENGVGNDWRCHSIPSHPSL